MRTTPQRNDLLCKARKDFSHITHISPIRPIIPILCIAIALLSLLCSCTRSKPSTFYLLTPISQSAEVVTSPTPATVRIIGVGPIDFPPYLDRTQMVMRKEDNTLTLSEFNRWAEPLGLGFQSVLIEDLSNLLSPNRVLAYPSSQTEIPAYRVQINVTRFDAGPDDNAHLRATWDIYTSGTATAAVSHTSSLTQPCPQKDYKAMAGALSKLVADLSQEIAEALAKLP